MAGGNARNFHSQPPNGEDGLNGPSFSAVGCVRILCVLTHHLRHIARADRKNLRTHARFSGLIVARCSVSMPRETIRIQAAVSVRSIEPLANNRRSLEANLVRIVHGLIAIRTRFSATISRCATLLAGVVSSVVQALFGDGIHTVKRSFGFEKWRSRHVRRDGAVALPRQIVLWSERNPHPSLQTERRGECFPLW